MTLQLKGSKEPKRNEPCPCESGLKHKFCHGDPLKKAVCNRVANEKMVELIRLEQKKKGIMSWKYRCLACDTGFDEPVQGQIIPYRPMCPKCKSVNIEEIENKIGGKIT